MLLSHSSGLLGHSLGRVECTPVLPPRQTLGARDQGVRGAAASEASLPGLQIVVFFLCLHVTSPLCVSVS